MRLKFGLYVRFLLWVGLTMVFTTTTLTAQKSELSSDFHKKRREVLRSQLPENSIAVLFSAPIRNRSNDVDFVYHQDPSFFYLTGWKEPHAVIVIYSTPQTDENGTYSEKLYVRERDAFKEMWNGKRLGVKGAQEMGFERVADRSAFVMNENDYLQYNKVLMMEVRDDIHDESDDPYDLYDLQKTFKKQINYPDNFDAFRFRIYESIRTLTEDNVESLKRALDYYISNDPSLMEDPIIADFLNGTQPNFLQELKTKTTIEHREYNFDIDQLSAILTDMREIKTEEELILLKKAIQISAQGQVEVMKAIHPGMSEREIQGIHQLVYKKYGAAHEGYPSIVGAGENACVLHYIENDKTQLNNELILMDLGAEYNGYTADVTRTIPINGTFTEAQRQLYQIVYDAQNAGIDAARVGSDFRKLSQASFDVVAKGLLALGIIELEKDYRRYLPHGISHHIGLDVHDPGNYGAFEAQMVVTVEPGIYIPEGSPCDPKWWNIGIRIEDDILVTEDAPVLLSSGAPRAWEAIEAMMKEASPLDDFILPELTLE